MNGLTSNAQSETVAIRRNIMDSAYRAFCMAPNTRNLEILNRETANYQEESERLEQVLNAEYEEAK